MKKILYISIFLLTLGFGARAYDVQAETVMAAAVIGSEETRILSETLDVLEAVLDEVEVFIDENPRIAAANRVAFMSTLDGIGHELMAISGTIESRVAAARKTEEVAKAAPAPPPASQTGGLTVVEPPAESGKAAATANGESPLSPATLREGEVDGAETVASVRATARPGNIFWIVLIVLAALGVALWWWRRGEREEFAKAEVGKETPGGIAKPQEVMQGIPPDY